MIQVRKASERGHADHGWLDSYHSFSFADYYDPRHMGFRALRVINEDRVAPGKGFGTHGHRDMEIISYVLEGALSHKDSLGTGSLIRPGEIQRMSAGTGVMHSEFNASQTEPVHFLQIWLLPERGGIAPSYEQKAIAPADLDGKLRLIAAPKGTEGGDGAGDGAQQRGAPYVEIHQDARLYAGRLGDGQSARHALAAGRHGYLHVARGEVTLGEGAAAVTLRAGDGAMLSGEPQVALRGTPAGSEVLLFDLA